MGYNIGYIGFGGIVFLIVSALSGTCVIEPLIRKAKGDAKYDLSDSVYLPLAFVIFIASLVIILQNVPL